MEFDEVRGVNDKITIEEYIHAFVSKNRLVKEFFTNAGIKIKARTQGLDFPRTRKNAELADQTMSTFLEVKDFHNVVTGKRNQGFGQYAIDIRKALKGGSRTRENQAQFVKEMMLDLLDGKKANLADGSAFRSYHHKILLMLTLKERFQQLTIAELPAILSSFIQTITTDLIGTFGLSIARLVRLLQLEQFEEEDVLED